MWLALEKLGVPDVIVWLIQYFHEGMKVEIRLDRCLIEQFDVRNGLRQGFHMLSVLFKLFTGLVKECWLARIEGAEGVDISLKFKYDHRLFRKYTKNANVKLMMECCLHQQDLMQKGL